MLLLSIVAGFRIPTIRKLRACPKGGHERVGPLVANISRLVDFQSQTSLETCKIHTTISREQFVERMNVFLIVTSFNHGQFAVCVRMNPTNSNHSCNRENVRAFSCTRACTRASRIILSVLIVDISFNAINISI